MRNIYQVSESLIRIQGLLDYKEMLVRVDKIAGLSIVKLFQGQDSRPDRWVFSILMFSANNNLHIWYDIDSKEDAETDRKLVADLLNY